MIFYYFLKYEKTLVLRNQSDYIFFVIIIIKTTNIFEFL